jgi:hypothetical protein
MALITHPVYPVQVTDRGRARRIAIQRQAQEDEERRQAQAAGRSPNIPVYQTIGGKLYYNPNNTKGSKNYANRPVNPSTRVIQNIVGFDVKGTGKIPTRQEQKTVVKQIIKRRTLEAQTKIKALDEQTAAERRAIAAQGKEHAKAAKDARIAQVLATSKELKEARTARLKVTPPAKTLAAVAQLKAYETKPGLYDLNTFLKDKKGPGIATLRQAGFDWGTIKGAAKENAQDTALVLEQAKTPLAKTIWRGMTPWDESKGEKATIAGGAIMAAEIMIPGVYSVRHWDEMSGGERAFSIAMDIATLIPVGGALARGAKAVSIAGRGARIAGAAKGLGREIVAQARAPVDMLIHPLATAKGAAKIGRELTENLLHPGKIPEAVLTTADGTVRLKIDKGMSAEKAVAVRDQLMDLARKGDRPMIEVGGQSISLGQSPLMKATKGGVVHTTPQGEAFVNGLEVTTKKNPAGGIMPASEQGLFVANQPLPRFSTTSAFGTTGNQPAIMIFSKDIAAKAIPSGKVYKSPIGAVTEMELKFPVGTVLPAPKQKLFTRVGPLNQRVEIYLDKPLSLLQRNKLKGLALIEDLKAPFKPAITIKGRGKINKVSDEALENMIDEIKRAGNIDQARALTRARTIIQGQRVMPRVIDQAVGRVDPAKVKRERAELDRPTTRPTPTKRDPVRLPKRTRTEIRRAGKRPEARRPVTPERAKVRAVEPRERVRRPGEPKRKPVRPDQERPRVKRPDQERPRVKRPDEERPRVRRPDEPRRKPVRPEQPRAVVPRRVTPRGEAARSKLARKVTPKPRILPGAKAPELAPVTRFIRGTVAWKQGIGWWVISPPYTKASDRVFVLTKPKGATISADAKSAIGTIQALGGKAPITEKFDMGIVDVHLKTPPRKPSATKGRKAISFTPDKDKSYGGKAKKVGPYYTRGGAISRKPI